MTKENIEKLRLVCKNISILYVEDDKFISEQLEKLLKKIFTKVNVEKNGLLGLRNFTKNRQEIVITDISMPMMDGLEMSKKIKLLNPEQTIIVTSAHNDMGYLMQLIEIGVDKFISKPIDFNSFLTSISKVALSIYREKRDSALESRLMERKNLQAEILDSMIIPLVYFENDILNYANSSFKKYFLTKIDEEDLSSFKLGYLFEDKKYLSMSNSKLIEEIKNSHNCSYSIFNPKLKAFKKYSISISDFENCSGSLISFFNIDALTIEFMELNKQEVVVPKREEFKNRITDVLLNPKDEYILLCIGLKNREFIATYGGRKMNHVYKEFYYKLEKDLHEEISQNISSLYFFETNRYILLANKTILPQVKKKLNTFGTRNRYSFGSRLPFNIEFSEQLIESDMPLEEILEKVEGMLYEFD